MKTLTLLPGLLACCCAFTLADTVVLKDGSRLEGDVKRTESGWQITTPDGKVRTVGSDAVRSIELGGQKSAPQASSAAEGLASLRRSVEAIGDINQIIDRYQRFIENGKDPGIIEQAKKDLAMWRERHDKGLVKHGSRWVAPEEVAALQAQADDLAQQAREQLRQNRSREADALLQQAMEIDPQNPAALYLKGVVLYRADKLPEARKAFEAADQSLKDHAPTLNNLAVILWRQNQQAGALNYYDQAMQAEPVNKYILNNVAEALGSLPEAQKKAPGGAVAKAGRRFAEQDTLLQQRMAQQGLYRWGATWVNQAQLNDLKAAERVVREKLDSLQADFDAATARISQIDQEVRDNQRSMQDIQERCFIRDRDGNWIAMPLPREYYDLQTQNTRLRSEQAGQRAKLDTLRMQAKQAQQQVPVPQYTGVQQIVGVEGTPLPPSAGVPPASAPAPAIDAPALATAPASQPASTAPAASAPATAEPSSAPAAP